MRERWTVEVDGTKCVANGMCLAAAPEHFVLVDGISRPTAAEVAPLPEVLEAAGIRVLEPHAVTDELDDDNAFARLVLHPALRPLRMDERWIDSFSTLHKKQWVEFAKRLEAFFHAGGSLAQVLDPVSAGDDE